MKKESKISGPW